MGGHQQGFLRAGGSKTVLILICVLMCKILES
jgi:hypothetical protein